MRMKIRGDDGDGDDNDDEDGGNDDCGVGDDSDDGNDGMFGFQGSSSHFATHNDPLHPVFFPKNPNHFTHVHVHKQCLIKANLSIINDRTLDVNLRNMGQSPSGSVDSFHVTKRIPQPLNDSPSLPLLKWEEQFLPTLSWCKNKWVYFVRQL